MNVFFSLVLPNQSLRFANEIKAPQTIRFFPVVCFFLFQSEERTTEIENCASHSQFIYFPLCSNCFYSGRALSPPKGCYCNKNNYRYEERGMDEGWGEKQQLPSLLILFYSVCNLSYFRSIY